MIKNVLSLVLFLVGVNSLIGQSIPDGYYDGTDALSGQELKLKLHQIISNHTVKSYAEFRDTILPNLDEDPDNPDNIILFYKNNSIPKSNFASQNQADFWNREHTWPSSHGFSDDSDTAYTDVHNLRPSDATVNSSKSNKDFRDIENSAENAQGEAPDTYTDSDFWEPRDEIKGDVARILFYMSTRYESSRLDLEILDRETFSNDPEIGVLFSLLQWHSQDPVDDAERARHEGAYGYQNNRNPFVDHPEWVAEIWGDASDPLITVNQASFSADFGTVPFGESLVQQYPLVGYNLESNITVSVAEPFSLSIDGSDFSQSISLVHVDGQSAEEFTVYLKFEPSQEDGMTYQESVTHSTTNGDDLVLSVEGAEGDVAFTTILEARNQSLGTIANVTGVVIDAGNNSGNSRVIFDGTAGIVVRSFDAGNESANLLQGDSVVVSGGLSEYGNLLQIEESPIVLTIVKQNAELPTPQEITISQIGEDYESELVIVKNVSFTQAGEVFAGGGTNGNFELTDATGSVVFRVGNTEHPLVGTVIPEGLFDITGFVGQFFDDYQFSVRDANDIVSAGVTGGVTGDVITIAEARQKTDGESVTVQGIVIGGPNNNAVNRTIYDGTAGIVLRGLEFGHLTAALELGDSVLASGGLFDYQGLLQVEQDPVRLEVLNKGNALPLPQEILLSEVGEDYESELVLIKDLSFVETGSFAIGNYTISDGTDQITLRIGVSTNPLIGTEIPSGKIDLVCFIDQSNDDYRVFVETLDDLVQSQTILWTGAIQSKLDMIYPNPVGSSLTLIHDLGGDAQVTLYSTTGSLVKRMTDVNKTALDVSDLRSGLYLVVVTNGDQGYYARMIKK